MQEKCKSAQMLQDCESCSNYCFKTQTCWTTCISHRR